MKQETEVCISLTEWQVIFTIWRQIIAITSSRFHNETSFVKKSCFPHFSWNNWTQKRKDKSSFSINRWYSLPKLKQDTDEYVASSFYCLRKIIPFTSSRFQNKTSFVKPSCLPHFFWVDSWFRKERINQPSMSIDDTEL